MVARVPPRVERINDRRESGWNQQGFYSGGVEVMTLSVDCGGSGIKASVLDTSGTMRVPVVRVPTPYPLPPARLVDVIAELAQDLPQAHRITLGMPGMIRHGVVITTPHYITVGGPRTRVDPLLNQQWQGFDIRAALTNRLGVHALVLNDAEMHGAGVITGAGLELVLTLGTGLGSAHFDGGKLAPHLELSRSPIRRVIMDEFIGEPERRLLGNAIWSRRVRRVIDLLRPVFVWDRVYIGGGNSRCITPTVVQTLGDDVVIVPNSAAIVGGVLAWTLGI